MKIRSQYTVLLFVLIAGFASCKKDNYDPPSSKLSGKLVYNGDPIGVEYDKVTYELYQQGFGKTGPLTETFTPDGSYSALLFNGDYKFTIPAGQGPFMWKKTAAGNPDSLAITLTGSQNLDIEVTPYYMIRTPQLTFSGGTVNAVFTIEKIITDGNAKNIQTAILYISKTAFADNTTNIGRAEIDGATITGANATLSVAVPEMVPAQNFVYARIGVKIEGVEDMIFSPVQKLTF